MKNLCRRLRAAWMFLKKYPVVALPDNYWSPADAKALSNFLGSDTGIKLRHIRWNRVYQAQQQAVIDRKDSAYSAGIAFGIYGSVAEEDSLLQVSLPETEFKGSTGDFKSVNR